MDACLYFSPKNVYKYKCVTLESCTDKLQDYRTNNVLKHSEIHFKGIHNFFSEFWFNYASIIQPIFTRCGLGKRRSALIHFQRGHAEKFAVIVGR
jgi:hypothetical protein